MLIDWFTVGAQVLNFVVLVWLLKRLLYRPILDAIDAREKRIADELADADAKKAEARAERDEFARRNREFDAQRASLLGGAAEEAKLEGERLMEAARAAAEALALQRRKGLEAGQKSLGDALARRAREEVFAIARRALSDLAGADLEDRMVGVFSRHLHDMEDTARAEFRAGLATDGASALVRSTFELSAAQRATIQQAAGEVLAAGIGLRFETSPDLIGGIELTAGGRKLGWSIADYLVSLERGVGELLAGKAQPEGGEAPARR